MILPPPLRSPALMAMVLAEHDRIVKTGERGWFTIRFNYPATKDIRRGDVIKAAIESTGRSVLVHGDLTEAD